MFAWMLDHVAPFTTCRESAFLLRAAKWCNESNNLRLRTTLGARGEEVRKHEAELAQLATEDAYSITRTVVEAWIRRRCTEELFPRRRERVLEELAELYDRGEL